MLNVTGPNIFCHSSKWKIMQWKKMMQTSRTS